MPRNLDRRVETLFPIEAPSLKRVLIDEILQRHLRDTAQARRLLPDGSYERVAPAPDELPFNSQEWFMAHWRGEAPRPSV
jgi:polyphosphate kinase